jgi:hypothetical protein
MRARFLQNRLALARKDARSHFGSTEHHICLTSAPRKPGTSAAADAWSPVVTTEKRMTKSGLLGAAAVALATVLAWPATAQQVIYNPGFCSQFYPDANCQNKGPNNPYTGDYQRRTVYRNGDWNANAGWNNDGWNNGWHESWNDERPYRRHDSGFWPGEVAAGVVGGAVGTAGAIATAPFRGDAYAYDDNSGRGWDRRTYAQRNGFVCEPGTWFKGADGRRQRCQ